MFILTILLLYLVHFQACRSYEVTWGGLTPLYVLQTVSSFCWLFLTMVRDPHQPPPVLQVGQLSQGVNSCLTTRLMEQSWKLCRSPVRVAKAAHGCSSSAALCIHHVPKSCGRLTHVWQPYCPTQLRKQQDMQTAELSL